MTKTGRSQLSLKVEILNEDGERVGLPMTLINREAWALRKLIDAGERGVSSLDHVGPRLSHYVFKMRGYGISIETVHTRHSKPFPGNHAVYKLRSKLTVLEEAGKVAA